MYLNFLSISLLASVGNTLLIRFLHFVCTRIGPTYEEKGLKCIGYGIGKMCYKFCDKDLCNANPFGDQEEANN